MSDQELTNAFDVIKAFMRMISSNEIYISNIWIFFEHEGLGYLSLNYEHSLQYHECLNHLIKTFINNDDISRRSIEKEFQKAILKVRSQANYTANLEENIDKELNNLEKELTAECEKYVYFTPINGLKAEGLPYTIGSSPDSYFR